MLSLNMDNQRGSVTRRAGRSARQRSLLAGVLLLWGPIVATAMEPEQGVRWSRLAGVAAVTGWGMLQWNYFDAGPSRVDEGWFGARTREGGADKLGHLYSSHVMTQALADLYEHWGLPRQSAGKQAALSSLLVLGYMEIGDSFSPDYGFSAEDLAMNLAGSFIGYHLYASHPWRHRVDLRIEYRPAARDPFTDYSHHKFLVALKLEGFSWFSGTPLEWLELHAGYYARGYDSPEEADSRQLFAGVGLNLSRLLRLAHLDRTSRLFNYWQPPETSLAAERHLSP